jgi:putative RNA 2'-phosphotransferase
MKDLTSTGKFLSLILRHKPETVGISLDEHGWANVEELIAGVRKSRPAFDLAMLEEIVATNNKQRYSFNEDHSLIRANQGHSIPVDVELEQAVPPAVLYHGTGEKFVESILRTGLVPKSRLYVHLSKDVETARAVGKRHGKSVVFQVDALKMTEDGLPFFLSKNGIWLTAQVNASYLHQLA